MAPFGAAADGDADQVASLDPGADGGVDQGADEVVSPDPAADGGVDQAADQVASPDPGADGGADQVATLETPCDEFSDEDTEDEVSASLPSARKVWKVYLRRTSSHFSTQKKKSQKISRYKAHVSGDDTSNFTKKC